MAKKSFNFKNTKKRAQQDQEKRGGGSVNRMKLTGGMNRVLILPPYNKNGDMWKRVMVHQVWKGGKPIATATCARTVEGEECPICKQGFAIKDKYQDHKSEKKQNAYRLFMPTNDVHTNVLDLKARDNTVKVLKLPSDAYELLLNEVDESSDGKDIFDFDEGRPLRIKGNGKDGRNRRYVVTKFEKNVADLLADGKIEADEAEEILKSLVDLDKLEPKYNEKKLKLVFNKVKAQAENIIGKIADDEDEDEVDDEDDDDIDDIDEVDEDDDDIDDEDDDDTDEDDEDDEDDLDDEDDEDDDDLDDEDDEDDDDLDDEDDEDEDEEPPKKQKKKPATKKKPAKKSLKKKPAKKKRKK